MVATRDHCFEVPGLSRIGERQNLEVPPWDLWRPLGLGNLKHSWTLPALPEKLVRGVFTAHRKSTT